MGYAALGHLLEKLDGRPLAASLSARILTPLGMSRTEPAITPDIFERTVNSYQVTYSDRPYPQPGAVDAKPTDRRNGRAGCIASTTRDMGAYLTLLITAGRWALTDS